MDLWTEKYRPKELDEYVWKDPKSRAQVESWLGSGSLPHLLLSGVQGSGKTSLAKLMFRQLNVPSADVLEINASRERNPDVIANKILGFCSTMSMSGMKYILLDEADSMTPLAQRILRGEMENYHEAVRFILTCNYPNKIIPAIHSRCQGFHFKELDEGEFTTRIANILMNEGIEIATEEDIAIIGEYVKHTHPDMRKCINLLQQNVHDGKLNRLVDTSQSQEWIAEATTLFVNNQFTEARKLIVEKASPEEYGDVYRFFYQNLDLWGSTEDQQGCALLAIRQGLVNHGLVADVEINLAATIAHLMQIARS
jgi:replication factor C small subunit